MPVRMLTTTSTLHHGRLVRGQEYTLPPDVEAQYIRINWAEPVIPAGAAAARAGGQAAPSTAASQALTPSPHPTPTTAPANPPSPPPPSPAAPTKRPAAGKAGKRPKA